MVNLFLDTEFNGFGGKLISMALVPEAVNLEPFYCEIEMRDQLHPWVKENVAPHLVLVPVSYSQFQQKLFNYLWDKGDCNIIADWPDDIKYFCEALILGPGQMPMMHNMKFELDFGIEYVSKVPHNALHDATAIRDSYVNREFVNRRKF